MADTLRHLRARIDFAIPVPDSYTGDVVAQAVLAMPTAVKNRLNAFLIAARACKADCDLLYGENTVWGVAHLCNHRTGQSAQIPCPPDSEL
jgi:hypothetical protein